MTAQRTRYAVVGLGSRSRLFTEALVSDYRSTGVLVGFCDLNQTRMDYYNRLYAEQYDAPPVPTYKPHEFERMLAEQSVDTVIVTSVDRTHDEYVIRAMRHGCDVICEKPMTVDAERCRAILATQQATGRQLIVTFNARYAPRNTQVKEILDAGVIGRIQSVHFEWLLDTRHGADYFRRWHRDKANSGGLMVHKATHHFDLVNWWVDSGPETVFGFGKLAFYGRANALSRGEQRLYQRAHGTATRDDPWALHLDDDPQLRGLYLQAEHEDGYFRDQNVFAPDITIEDDMALVVRYTNGVTMSYHLTAYSPWEGFRVMFNGTAGRLEVTAEENTFARSPVSDSDADTPLYPDATVVEREARDTILLRPHWGRPQSIPVIAGQGQHAGGDARLLADLFATPGQPRSGPSAGPLDGARSILTGIAANQSFATSLPVTVRELVDFPGL